MKYGENNSRAKASLVWWDRRLSGTINALKRKPEGPRRALDNNAAEPDRTAVVTVFASLVSDGNLDFTNIPARLNPSLTITDDDDDADFSGRADDHRNVGSPLRGSRTHKIYPRRNILTSQSACKSQGVSARCMGAIALLVAAALGLGVGEAQAQTAVCSNTPAAEERIRCTTSDDVDIDIDVKDVTITTTGEDAFGIGLHQGTQATSTSTLKVSAPSRRMAKMPPASMVSHLGAGDVNINVNIDAKDSAVTTNGQTPTASLAASSDAGDVNIDVKDSAVTTKGQNAHGIYGLHQGTETDVNIDAQGRHHDDGDGVSLAFIKAQATSTST